MKRAALAVALVLFAATSFAADESKAIRQVLDDQVAAWNHGDLEGYMRGYWNSPDLEFFGGTSVTKGWQPTLERYRKRYQSDGREMGQLAFADVAIDVLSPDAAFVRGRWQLTMKSGPNPSGTFTLVMRKLKDGWRIVHDHSS